MRFSPAANPSLEWSAVSEEVPPIGSCLCFAAMQLPDGERKIKTFQKAESAQYRGGSPAAGVSVQGGKDAQNEQYECAMFPADGPALYLMSCLQDGCG